MADDKTNKAEDTGTGKGSASTQENKSSAPPATKEVLEVSLGEFVIAAVNDKGAEARLSSEKHQSNVLSRFATANKQLPLGAKGELIWRQTAEPPQPDNVLVEVPADRVPDGAKIIEQ